MEDLSSGLGDRGRYPARRTRCMGKLTIRNLLAIITGTAIAFSLVFAPFTPSVSLSEFGLIPAEYEHQFNPDISVSVTNNGILPVWLRSSEFGTRTRSHVRYFVQRDCAGQELGEQVFRLNQTISKLRQGEPP